MERGEVAQTGLRKRSAMSGVTGNLVVSKMASPAAIEARWPPADRLAGTAQRQNEERRRRLASAASANRLSAFEADGCVRRLGAVRWARHRDRRNDAGSTV